MAGAIRILYVDDEPELLNIGKLFLEESGDFTITTALSATEGIRLLEQEKFDAIVSDYQMPGMDGIQFLVEVRSRLGPIPFILFTGRGREEVVIQAINSGVDFYLQKGGEPGAQFAELTHKIKAAASRKRADEELHRVSNLVNRILARITDSVISLDTEWRYTYCNEIALKLIRGTHDEIIGRCIWDVFPDIVGTIFWDKYHEAMREQVPVVFDNYYTPYEVWTAVRVFPSREGLTIVVTDITERKKAEEELNESERRFRELSDLLPQTVYDTDVNGILTYANRIAFQWFGYTEEEFKQGLNVLQMIAPHDRERAGVAFRAIIEGTGTKGVSVEYRALKKDGSTFPISIYSSPVIVQGRITGLRGIIIDITERKKAEDALNESELLFREVFNNANDSVFLLERTSDGPGKYLLVNDKAVQMLGYSKEEFMKMSPRDLVPEDIAKKIMPDVIKKLLKDGHATFESVHKRKDGSTYPIEVSTHTFNYKGWDVDLSIIRDITERKRAEEALRESGKKFRSMVEASPDMIWDIDMQGIFSYISSQCITQLGYAQEDLIGKPFVTLIQPEFANDIKKLFLAHVQEKDSFKTLEVPAKRRDGSPCFIEIRSVPIIGNDGQITGFHGIAHDITERKRAEEAIRQANKKLTLLSSITRHDITNQLTILLGYHAMLEKKQPDLTLNNYFITMKTAAQRISSMIQFTKEYDKIGVNSPVWQDCRMVVETAAKEASLGKVMVKNDLPTGAEIFADPLIAKVIYNLIDNAVRYGGKITAIRFSVEEREGDHLVVCEDDGDGVIAEEKEKIFERGFGKNTGLGLALSREILSITGITIRETGEPGKGARFEMVVPKGMWRIERRIT